MAVRLVFVDLDCDLLRLMVRMVVIVVAVKAMHMGRGCCRRCVGVSSSVCMSMPTSAVGAAFRFKSFVDFVDDQVH